MRYSTPWLIVSLLLTAGSGYSLYWLISTIWAGVLTQNAWMILGGGILVWIFGGLLLTCFAIGLIASIALIATAWFIGV
jgi:hypothetical protein